MQSTRFTLIELLVVVAIIAILAAMLVPALGMAREQAKRVQCAGGVRQVGLAVRLYQDDNDGWYPRDLVGGNNPGTHRLLVDERYIGEQIFTAKGCSYGPATYSPAAGNSAYTPPKSATTAFGINDRLVMGIGIKIETKPALLYTYHGQQSDRLLRIQREPERVMVAACSIVARVEPFSQQHTLGIPTIYQTAAIVQEGKRHRGRGLQWAFVDGHVETITWREIVTARGNPTTEPWSTAEWSFTGLYYRQGMDW